MLSWPTPDAAAPDGDAHEDWHRSTRFPPQESSRRTEGIFDYCRLLYVCFTALAYFKAAILQAHGVSFAPFGSAAIKALIFAKFMSVGHAIHLGERHRKEALIWPTLRRSFAFLAL